MKTETNKNLAQVAGLLIKNKFTVAVAESCTSGLLQNLFSLADEAMTFYQGGMTVYNAGQKAKQLNINPIFAEQCNSVSKEIAEQMSLEIARQFNAEIGIAITGYAQSVPTDHIENCYAYIAFSKNAEVILSTRIMGDAALSLAENQEIYAEKILKKLIEPLNKIR